VPLKRLEHLMQHKQRCVVPLPGIGIKRQVNSLIQVGVQPGIGYRFESDFFHVRAVDVTQALK